MTLSETAVEIFSKANATPLGDVMELVMDSISFLPTDKLDIPSDLSETLDQVGIANFNLETTTVGDVSTSTASVQLIFVGELSLPVFGIEGVSLVLGSNDGKAGGTKFEVSLTWGEEYAFELRGTVALRFAPNLLKRVQLNSENEWEPIKGVFSEVAFETKLRIESEGNVDLEVPTLTLEKSMIGDTGFVIGGVIKIIANDTAQRDLNSEHQIVKQVIGPGFRGVFIPEASLDLPPSLQKAGLPALKFTDCCIGNNGFTGHINMKFTDLDGEIFGITAGLEEISIDIVQNAFLKAELIAGLELPFFENKGKDKRLRVTVGFGLDGSATVQLDRKGGLVSIEKTDVLKLTLDSLGFKYEAGVFSVIMSGELEITYPLGDTKWPAFKVKELCIDSSGGVKLDGGWLALPDKYSVDFFGFKLEISKLGFGNTDDGGKWIGFSGAIRLVDGFSAGASVKGLRIAWYDDGRNVNVSFEGIGVELDVPDVLSFKGAVSYKEVGKTHRFHGDITLNLIAVGVEIDGKLVVGVSDEPGVDTYFAIYLGVELPAGIPLWATGLALYGLAGLFAYNMEPDKHDDEEWYGELEEKKGWYQRDPIGIVALDDKWVNQNGSLAIGAGVTIGTVYDNGFTFAGKFLLVLVFPGPIILLEGKVNFLKERAKIDEDEPVIRALAVLDFRNGIVQFGLHVNFNYGKEGELVTLAGGCEVFFSTTKPDAWHIWIGRKEPRDKRIHVKIFRLFGAEFYLMVDNNQFAMGSWVGYESHWRFGPVYLDLEAWLEWNVLVNFKPAQVHGDIWLHGKIGVGIGPIGLALTADARLEGDIFHPFHILGTIDVAVDLPWPLPDFSFGVRAEWGPEPVPPPIPHPLKEVALEHPKASLVWPLPRGALLAPNYEDEKEVKDEDKVGEGMLAVTTQGELDTRLNAVPNQPPAGAPVVPLDVRPRLTFGRSVHDDRVDDVRSPLPIGGFIQSLDYVGGYERVGDPAKQQGPLLVRYGLVDVVFQKWDGKNWPDAVSYRWYPATKTWTRSPKLAFGTWAPVPESPAGEKPEIAQVKLWLWMKNPFNWGRTSGVAWGNWFFDEFCPNYPCLPPVETSEVCCDFEGEPLLARVRQPWTFAAQPALRVSWAASDPPAIAEVDGMAFSVGRPLRHVLRFIHTTDLEYTILLPEPTTRVTLYVNDAAVLEVKGVDDGGEERFTAVALAPASPDAPGRVVVDGGGESVAGVRVRRRVPAVQGAPQVCLTWLAGICFTRSTPGANWREGAERHMREEMRRWSDVGEVLDPDTDYRMKIVTEVRVRGDGALANYDPRDLLLTEYAYFRTEGPPGLVELTDPASLAPPPDPPPPPPTTPPKPEMDKVPFRETQGGLADLTGYVRQTSPPTVGAPGEKSLLPRPVYRAYDIGIEYNETYVDLMYRLSQRDLGLYLFDNNSVPAHDVHGRLAIATNYWGHVDTVTLTDTDKFWLVRKNDVCAPFDTFEVATHPRQGTSGLVLEADTVYEARLIPNAVHDDFRFSFDATTGKGLSINRRTGSIGGWTKRAEAPMVGREFNEFSSWEVIRSGDQHFMTQTLDYGLGTSPTATGAMLYHVGSGRDPAKSPSLDWTDCRVSVLLPVSDTRPSGGAIGVAFRYQPATNSYYVFQMSNVSGARFRHLAKVTGGVYEVLTPKVADPTGFAARDHQVTIEAVGRTIQVFLDGQPFLSHTEPPEVTALEKGTVGLLCWGNPVARFADVRVEDLGRTAPVLYAFHFTTSRFTNFFHHVHSFQDETFRLTVADDLGPALALAAGAPEGTPSIDEAQAYEALAEKVIGTDRLQFPTAVEVVQVEHGAGQENEVVALLVRGPEPIDWKRTTIELLGTGLAVPAPAAPGTVKVTDVTWAATDGKLNDESVTLLLRQATDLSDATIEFRPANTESVWRPYYTFAKEDLLADGTQIVVHSGRRADGLPSGTGVERRFLELADGEPPLLAPDGVDLRLTAGGHARRFLPDDYFRPSPLEVVRKADGSAFFLVRPAATGGDPSTPAIWSPGLYRVRLTYRRDNRAFDPTSPVQRQEGSTEPERVIVDIPIRSDDLGSVSIADPFADSLT